MSAEDKKIIQNIAQAAELLPDDKREFILGYAEGVIAMAAAFGKEKQDVPSSA